MEAIFSLAILAQTLRISIPFILAALGGVIAERAGVISITLEGFLLIGAFGATWGAYEFGPVTGLCLGVLMGAAFASLHALAVVRFRVDAIVSGIALNLMAIGLTRFLLKLVFGSSSNSKRINDLGESAFLSEFFAGIPGIGPLFAELCKPLVLLTIFLAVAVYFCLYRTPFGLRIRAVGEHPEAAESAGVSVSRIRWVAVIISGALAGLGGVYLAFSQHNFSAGMTANRGYIALAAVILGKWRPGWVLLACLFFALAEAIELNLQAASLFPSQLVQMIPYLLTIVAVAGVIGVSRPPAALGKEDEIF